MLVEPGIKTRSVLTEAQVSPMTAHNHTHILTFSLHVNDPEHSRESSELGIGYG